jgi:cell division protein FtsQ
MKNIIQIIAVVLLFGGSVLLGTYFDRLWQQEKLQQADLYIFPSEKSFIVPEEVKQIIKIKDSVIKSIKIDSLEKLLEKNDYIRNAEVYKDLNGRLVAEIEQYKPIARILGTKSYYIDIDGNEKPLSNHYTERVVLVFGNITEKNKSSLTALLKKIYEDKELNMIISEIHLEQNKIRLKINGTKANVIMNIPDEKNRQLYKLKVFNAYLHKKHLENKYKEIDLRFENQVVCR